MKTKAFKAAFPHTIPILAGFLFLGFAYGIYMQTQGFGVIYPVLISILVFGGSLQFIMVELLISPFAPLSVFIVALLLQARHLFYGLSMLNRYKGLGLKKPYLIFGLCDETFSINCSVLVPQNIDKGWFYFFVTILDHSYWVCGTLLGALFGSLLKSTPDGIDFVLTAMFVVIFLEQILKEKSHIPSAAGLILSVICLMIFGKDSFLIPTMISILILLYIAKTPIEKKESKGELNE